MFCNTELGAKRFGTYEERLHFMYERLQLKIEKETLWSKDELDELQGNLKRMITARQLTLKKELINRLRGVESNILAIDNGLVLV